jgi:hypothetical protein
MTVSLRAAQDGWTEDDIRCKRCAGTGRLPWDPWDFAPGEIRYRCAAAPNGPRRTCSEDSRWRQTLTSSAAPAGGCAGCWKAATPWRWPAR